ncbi:acyl-CoA/acyl-ACP dehydrogenase [Mitsuaria sp. CC2]|uniref:acyl-CoA dehydrogenase n=1 Tax=Mitsuaria sp. CC2 TaxID=3029186 RepID=UPI003B8BE636
MQQSAVIKAMGSRLRALIDAGRADLPLPGGGRTLERWSALAAVAAQDLSLVKLFEGHTDAMAILAEAGGNDARATRADVPMYGMWAAEPPGARVVFRRKPDGTVVLSGTKAWCSGAASLDRALLTVWPEISDPAGPGDARSGDGPWLADVDLRQPGISIDAARWKAVGMADSESASVAFEAVSARLVGDAGFYLSRPGFWHGGIGIAACWHGAACAVAEVLRTQAVAITGGSAGPDPGWHRALALGEVDRVLSANAALLREAAAWVDGRPQADARAWALRTRAASDECAQQVLRAATRAMGAGPLCHDGTFARLAADLPVFIRQCHGDRDLVALGNELLKHTDTTWTL